MTDEEELIPTAIAADAYGSVGSMPADAANSMFKEFIGSVTRGCVKAGSKMIGHIKANVRSGGELLSMSSTTDDGNVRCRSLLANEVNDYSLTVNVIVYGLDRRTAARILAENAERILTDVKIKIYSESGCEEPDCGDPMCSNKDHKRVIDIV